MVDKRLVVVDGFVAHPDEEQLDLREEVWSFALDQRAFGPGRLVVVFADEGGRFRSLAHAELVRPAELTLGPCIRHAAKGASAAVAFCDEPVAFGPPPPELALRFELARSIADDHEIHLVDWISCDPRSELVRSTRLALDPSGEWWDVPGR